MAKVYVGTYKKYNAGDLSGAWLDLANYSNYSDFLAACEELHKDEREPELMIQDTENFPDGLDCMEWLSERDFNDVKAATEEDKPQFDIVEYSAKALAVIGDTKPIKEELKKLGGRFNPRLSCGAGWIFSKKQEAALRQLQSGCEVKSNKTAPQKDEAGYVANLQEYAAGDAYTLKEYVGAAKINGFYYLIEKPSIKNRFCFRDEGPDYDVYSSVTSTEEKLARYFMVENLDVFDRWLKDLKAGKRHFVAYGSEYDKQRLFIRDGAYYENPRENEHEMTAEERETAINALEWGRSQFEKRLKSYLKRYGVSKLHTWTYWADA